MSDPVFGPDGTGYLIAGIRDAQGQDQRSLVALDAAGYARPGWPIEEPPGSDFGSVAVAPDGSVYVVHRLASAGKVEAYKRDGHWWTTVSAVRAFLLAHPPTDADIPKSVPKRKSPKARRPNKP